MCFVIRWRTQIFMATGLRLTTNKSQAAHQGLQSLFHQPQAEMLHPLRRKIMSVILQFFYPGIIINVDTNEILDFYWTIWKGTRFRPSCTWSLTCCCSSRRSLERHYKVTCFSLKPTLESWWEKTPLQFYKYY